MKLNLLIFVIFVKPFWSSFDHELVKFQKEYILTREIVIFDSKYILKINTKFIIKLMVSSWLSLNVKF